MDTSTGPADLHGTDHRSRQPVVPATAGDFLASDSNEVTDAMMGAC